jgi:hypothetical protein
MGFMNFSFGGCLGVFDDGTMIRSERTYTVPSGWDTGPDYAQYTRLEVWQVAP